MNNNEFDYLDLNSLNNLFEENSDDFYSIPKVLYSSKKYAELDTKEKILYVMIEDVFGFKEVDTKKSKEVLISEISNIVNYEENQVVESLKKLKKFGLVDFTEIADDKVDLYVKSMEEVIQEI